MMRASLISVLLAAAVPACGGDDGGTPDDASAVDAAGDPDAPGPDAAMPDAPAGCGTMMPPLTGITGTEGIAIAADGTVYYSQTGHVGRWVPGAATPENTWVPLAGTTTVWGMAIAPDGTLYVATPGSTAANGTIWRIDTTAATPAGTPLYPNAGRPNGLTLAPDGAIVYGDFAGGHVYRVTTGGDRTQVTATTIAAANGVLFDADGTLLVAQYGNGVVHRLTLDAAHQETARENAFTGTGRPDGLARDDQGRVYVTDNQGGRVLRFTPGNAMPEVLLMNVGAAANLAFGRGALPCTDVYVTSSGALRRIDAGAAGVP